MMYSDPVVAHAETIRSNLRVPNRHRIGTRGEGGGDSIFLKSCINPISTSHPSDQGRDSKDVSIQFFIRRRI